MGTVVGIVGTPTNYTPAIRRGIFLCTGKYIFSIFEMTEKTGPTVRIGFCGVHRRADASRRLHRIYSTHTKHSKENILERKLNDNSELVRALACLQTDLLPLTENKDNPFAETKYLDLSEILKVARPKLRVYGVLLQQLVDIQNDPPLVTVETTLCNAKGEYMRCGGSLGPTEMHKANATQKLGASITYLRRFQAMTILGIVGTEDDDEKTFKPSPEVPERDDVTQGFNPGPTDDDQRSQIIDAIWDLMNDKKAAFTKQDELNTKAAISNARTLSQLQHVLADVQDAYTEKTKETK